MYTQATELYSVAVLMMNRAQKIQTSEIRSAQDAMINLRVEWEDIQATLRSRKLEGFEPVVDKITNLAATALAMAAALQAKILTQRDAYQIAQDKEKEEKENPTKITKRQSRKVVIS